MSMPILNWRNSLQGSLIYAGGDAVAAALTGDFQWSRALGVLCVGGTLYAIEIPAYFGWLERKFQRPGRWNAMKRALCAQAFFNPLWIARHVALLRLFTGRALDINADLLLLGLASFLHALPIALPINYGIQNALPLPWRFPASALFSSATAVYYALSEVLFG